MTPAICVDVATAASMLGVSVTVLRSYIDSGLIPVVKYPSTKHHGEESRRVLLAVSDLHAFVDKHRSGDLLTPNEKLELRIKHSERQLTELKRQQSAEDNRG